MKLRTIFIIVVGCILFLAATFLIKNSKTFKLLRILSKDNLTNYFLEKKARKDIENFLKLIKATQYEKAFTYWYLPTIDDKERWYHDTTYPLPDYNELKKRCFFIFDILKNIEEYHYVNGEFGYYHGCSCSGYASSTIYNDYQMWAKSSFELIPEDGWFNDTPRDCASCARETYIDYGIGNSSPLYGLGFTTHFIYSAKYRNCPITLDFNLCSHITPDSPKTIRGIVIKSDSCQIKDIFDSLGQKVELFDPKINIYRYPSKAFEEKYIRQK